MKPQALQQPPPPSQRIPGRTELGWLQGLLANPNAIWIREVRQSARLDRTPWLLFAVTLLLSLLVASIGGTASSASVSPAKVGMAVSQVFFSLAYGVVTLVGPAVAANTIAAEREGRTWEALVLTGMTPAQIARGKFLSSFTTLSLYIAAIAPIGALSFAFGGTTATETIVGFILLFMLAGLWVAFGLAMSAAMSSLRGAIVLTLILAIIVGPVLYVIFGPAMSALAHEHWSQVPAGLPIWLPVAYTRANFGIDYLVLLVALPFVVLALPAWFLYEVTVANLSAKADDRSSGLKRWFIVSTLAGAGLAAAAPASLGGRGTPPSDPASFATHTALWCLGLFFGFCALLFIGEPAGPSRRLTTLWSKNNVGALGRALGPGLARTFMLVMLLETCAFGAATFGGVFAMGIFHKGSGVLGIMLSGATLWAHVIFFTGLSAWLRARTDSPLGARIIALAVMLALVVLPWAFAAVGGIATKQDEWLALGATNPFYVVVILGQLAAPAPNHFLLIAGYIGILFFGAAGLVLFTLAQLKARAINAASSLHYVQLDAALAAEDSATTTAP